MKKLLAVFLCMVVLIGVSTMLLTVSAAGVNVAEDSETSMKVLDLFKYFLAMVNWGDFFAMVTKTLQGIFAMFGS